MTNYAINKDSETFKISEKDIADGKSSKRKLKTVYDRLEANGVDIHLLKLKIVDIIIKTLMSVQSDLLHNYRVSQPNDRSFSICFEVLGFDVLIDEEAKPWLLEVNQAPSFATDSEIDQQVKSEVITDTFRLLGLSKVSRQKQLDRLQ